jgi:hypothetical protein
MMANNDPQSSKYNSLRVLIKEVTSQGFKVSSIKLSNKDYESIRQEISSTTGVNVPYDGFVSDGASVKPYEDTMHYKNTLTAVKEFYL